MIHSGAGHKIPETQLQNLEGCFRLLTLHEGMTACPEQSISASGEFGEKSCYSGSALVFQLHFTSSTGQSLEDSVTYPSLEQKDPEPQVVISLCIFS